MLSSESIIVLGICLQVDLQTLESNLQLIFRIEATIECSGRAPNLLPVLKKKLRCMFLGIILISNSKRNKDFVFLKILKMIKGGMVHCKEG